MYDGSAGFDLPDAVYLGHALSEANYRWYEEPMREFSVTAYRWLAERVDVPLLVGETSDGSHLNTADFIASGCATYVRTSANHRGGMTGAMRIAHLADSFRLRAEVHGPTESAVHLCMAIPNCTYYESLVTSNPVDARVACRAGRSRPRARPRRESPCRSSCASSARRRTGQQARLDAPQPLHAKPTHTTKEEGVHMKLNRRWLALVLPIAARLVAAAHCWRQRRGSQPAAAVGLDHRLGRRRPPAGGEALRQDAPERAREHRHLRRRRQRRDDDADEDPALEPHRQRLAGRHLHRAGQRPGLDGRRSRSTSRWTSRASSRQTSSAAGPQPSLAQCTVNGHLVCLQDNLAQEVLYVNKKLMNQFGYKVPTTWQQWAALGQKVAKEHPGYIIGNIGDSYGHWLYLWANKCPISQVVGAEHRQDQRVATCTARAWRSLLDPLIKSGVVPPESVFTADFAKKYGGANDKILMMPGPTWYAQGHLQRRRCTSRPARSRRRCRCAGTSEPLTTGQVGGGPWVVSKHTKNMAAAVDFVKWATTSPTRGEGRSRRGTRRTAPLPTVWL